jgi:hypothetical protein
MKIAMVDTDDLIARLEDASEPTNDLRLDVARWCYENGVGGVNYDPELWLVRNGSHLDSVDAAMMLVPEGWDIEIVIRFERHAIPTRHTAKLYREETPNTMLAAGCSRTDTLAILLSRLAIQAHTSECPPS